MRACAQVWPKKVPMVPIDARYSTLQRNVSLQTTERASTAASESAPKTGNRRTRYAIPATTATVAIWMAVSQRASWRGARSESSTM